MRLRPGVRPYPVKRFQFVSCCIVPCVLIVASCNEPRHDFAGDIDALCACAGLKLTGAVTATTNPEDRYTVADFQVAVDGTTRRYHAHFNQRHFLYNFLPEDYAPYMTSNYLDTVHDQNTRASLIEHVKLVNVCLKWKLYGGPIIQPIANAFLVTYLSVPEEEVKKNAYLDPYVTFIISPSGTVLGAFYMAGA